MEPSSSSLERARLIHGTIVKVVTNTSDLFATGSCGSETNGLNQNYFDHSHSLHQFENIKLNIHLASVSLTHGSICTHRIHKNKSVKALKYVF
jgi:hypothetical protein